MPAIHRDAPSSRLAAPREVVVGYDFVEYAGRALSLDEINSRAAERRARFPGANSTTCEWLASYEHDWETFVARRRLRRMTNGLKPAAAIKASTAEEGSGTPTQ